MGSSLVFSRAKEDLVMLVALSMDEQRYDAVREVLDSGASITDVATRYGADRRTLHGEGNRKVAWAR